MSLALLPHPLFGGFAGAFEFIFSKQESSVTGGKKVGGIEQVLELAWTQIYVSVLALLLAMAIALPVALYFGHKGKGELIAVGIYNEGNRSLHPGVVISN